MKFEIVKGSGKILPKQNQKKEFIFLEKNDDTSTIAFVATVKLRGNDVTLFDLYFKLRTESQKLGANCFYILKPAYGDEGYYLLCNIYLADTSALKILSKKEEDNGKIFIIKPDERKYVGRNKIKINDSLNIELFSGTYYTINVKEDHQEFIIKKGNKRKKIYGRKDGVVYLTTYLPRGNSGLIIPIAVMTGAIGSSVWILSHKMDHYSMESAIGKLMLVFYTPIGTS